MKVYKRGDNVIFFICSVMGMITDLVFLTNLYNRKYPIKRYWLMIFIMGVSAVLVKLLNLGIYIIIFQVIINLITIYLFSHDKNSLTYFSLNFAMASLIDTFLFSTIILDYNYVYLIDMVIKLFFIIIIYPIISNINIKIDTITKKCLWILFSFLCLLSGIYLFMKGG